MDEKLVASGLNHYLEEPDDAAMAQSRQDAGARRSMKIRAAAFKAIIDLDHSSKWAQAIKYPSRTEKSLVSLFLPGQQVFFWKKASNKQHKKANWKAEQNLDKNLSPNPDLTNPDPGNPHKGRMSCMPERWHPLYGPAVVLGHEWGNRHMSDPYWVSYGGMCVLVPGAHMRHAEMEELMAEDVYFKELRKAMNLFSQTDLKYTNLSDDLDTPQPDPKGLQGSSVKPEGLVHMQSLFDERP